MTAPPKKKPSKKAAKASVDARALRAEIGLLAAKWSESLRRGDVTADDAGQVDELLAILWAISQPDGPARTYANKARSWLEARNRGPRKRTQEADRLANRVDREATKSAAERAEGFLRCLRVSPQIAADVESLCPLPPWDSEATGDAIKALEDVLQRAHDSGVSDPEIIVKRCLRALGMTDRKASDLFAYRSRKAEREARRE